MSNTDYFFFNNVSAGQTDNKSLKHNHFVPQKIILMLFNNYSQDDGHYIARGDVHVIDYEGYLTFVTITFNIMKRLCEKSVVPLIRDEVSLLYMYAKLISFIFMWSEAWATTHQSKNVVVHECKTHIMF